MITFLLIGLLILTGCGSCPGVAGPVDNPIVWQGYLTDRPDMYDVAASTKECLQVYGFSRDGFPTVAITQNVLMYQGRKAWGLCYWWCEYDIIYLWQEHAMDTLPHEVVHWVTHTTDENDPLLSLCGRR